LAGVSRWVKPAMDAAFAVPVLAAVAWVQPLLREPLQLTDETFALARAGLLVAAAGAQLAATPMLVQGFLDGALVVRPGPRGRPHTPVSHAPCPMPRACGRFTQHHTNRATCSLFK